MNGRKYTICLKRHFRHKIKSVSQHKFLNRIIYTNEKLFAFKIVDSPYCTFCENEVESTEQLFFFCNVVILERGLSWMAIYSNEVNDISFLDVFFG